MHTTNLAWSFVCLFKTLTHSQLNNALRYVHSASAFEPLNPKSVVPTFRLASAWPNNIAISDKYGDYLYKTLFASSKSLADKITQLLGENRVQERIALLCPNDASYVIMQWACWMNGHVVVPLNTHHPREMLEYFLRDSQSAVLLSTPQFKETSELLLEKTDVKLLIVEDELRKDAAVTSETIDKVRKQTIGNLKTGLNPNLYPKLNALILYTSGSTAMPKGVVLSHANLCAQINSMIKCWTWTAKDAILHTLPLNHVHGIVNALLTPLHCGARCILAPQFDPNDVWDQLLTTKTDKSGRVTVFTAVPTAYVKLINAYENFLAKNDRMASYVKATCTQKVRLMMSGSAPLPETVFERWEQITGHRLLERYGMSEIGMALSNPLDGERKPGFVGLPMPGVSIRIVDNDKVVVEGNEFGTKIITPNSTSPAEHKYAGELQIKSENVFTEYWNKPEITKQEFTKDGWFKTGDTVQYVDNSYKILGRSSVDIIKTGGYKISALFVESILLQHPAISDVTVVGVPDNTWGQKVAAVIVPVEGKDITLLSLRNWAKQKMPSYTLPMSMKVVSQIPRNLMGKVNKKEIVKLMFCQGGAF